MRKEPKSLVRCCPLIGLSERDSGHKFVIWRWVVGLLLELTDSSDEVGDPRVIPVVFREVLENGEGVVVSAQFHIELGETKVGIGTFRTKRDRLMKRVLRLGNHASEGIQPADSRPQPGERLLGGFVALKPGIVVKILEERVPPGMIAGDYVRCKLRDGSLFSLKMIPNGSRYGFIQGIV